MNGENELATRQRILAELDTCRLTRIASCDLPMPGPNSPIVISVVRNEFGRLHDFLRHHRRLGIKRFAFVDNASTDGTRELLAAQPDVDVFSCADTYSIIRKLAWLHKLLDEYGLDRWYLNLDADEHVVFDGSEHRSLDEMTRLMEARGIDRVKAIMIDMYAEGPVLKFRHEPHSALLETFPLFDGTGYRTGHTHMCDYYSGGPRFRIFQRVSDEFDPILTKFPLFRIFTGEMIMSAHFMWPYEKNMISPLVIALLHYKFAGDVLSKVNQSVQSGHFYGDSFEDRCLQRVFLDDPDTEFVWSGTRRYRTADDLLDAELIRRAGWPAPLTEPEKIAATDRRAAADSVSDRALAGYPADE